MTIPTFIVDEIFNVPGRGEIFVGRNPFPDGAPIVGQRVKIGGYTPMVRAMERSVDTFGEMGSIGLLLKHEKHPEAG